MSINLDEVLQRSVVAWNTIEGLRERTAHLDNFFPPITQSRSVSDVLFTGGRAVSDFSVPEYY